MFIAFLEMIHGTNCFGDCLEIEHTLSGCWGAGGRGGGSGVIDGTNLESGPLRRNVDVTK